MPIKVEINCELKIEDLEVDGELIDHLSTISEFDPEYQLTAEVTLGRPAFISGPPEKCYPAEPDEVEVVSDCFDVACALLEPVKSKMQLKCLCRLLYAMDRQIEAYAQSAELHERAVCEASIPPDPPEREDEPWDISYSRE